MSPKFLNTMEKLNVLRAFFDERKKNYDEQRKVLQRIKGNTQAVQALKRAYHAENRLLDLQAHPTTEHSVANWAKADFFRIVGKIKKMQPKYKCHDIWNFAGAECSFTIDGDTCLFEMTVHKK